MSLTVISTHPIQYHAPVYRMLQAKFGIPVTAIYGSDFSVVGYYDKEFDTTFSWDTDLLSGYQSIFLTRARKDNAKVSSRGLKENLKQIKPQVVLLTGYSPYFYKIAFYHAIRGGYPVLFRGETTDHTQSSNLLKICARRQLLKFFYERCAKLLYIGQRSYEHFKQLGCPDEKLIFSPYCVDAESFQYNEIARLRLRVVTRQELGITEIQKILLFSGKLIKIKGVDLFLKAVRELPTEMREDIVVVFLGSGELRRSLESIAQQSPCIKTFFLDFKNQTQISRYYHTADLLVLPSWSETWGLVVNEALHHGLPCVVSKAVGCAPDLIDPGVTGEIFETGNRSCLGVAIRRALNLVNKFEIRKRCRQKISKYAIENAAAGIAKAYWDILAESNHKRY